MRSSTIGFARMALRGATDCAVARASRATDTQIRPAIAFFKWNLPSRNVMRVRNISARMSRERTGWRGATTHGDIPVASQRLPQTPTHCSD